MTPRQAILIVRKHGVMLEAARGPVPNLASAIAGHEVRGSWWRHRRSREIFALTRAVRESPDILVCRLVDGHITYVHRRVWPALVRLAPRLSRPRLAALQEVHTTSGAHRIRRRAFPAWVPEDVSRRARTISVDAAIRLLGKQVVPPESSSDLE